MMLQGAGDATGLDRAAPSSALRLRGRISFESCRLSGEVDFLHIT
jgi:hypothetical protein